MAVFPALKSTMTFTPDYSVKPFGFAWRRHTVFIIATVGIGMFTDLFLYGLVVPILPYILQDSAEVPRDQVQGYVSGLLAAYAVASVISSPAAGILADSTSPRQAPYLGGLSMLIVSTILFFTGKHFAVLVVARLLQGASSGFVWTVGLALCMDTVGPENLGKTIGTMFSFIGVGELFAPILGGVLYSKGGEMAVLILALSILVVDLFMRLLVIEKAVAARYEAFDRDSDRNTHSESSTEDTDDDTDEETALIGNGVKAEDESFIIPPDQPRFIKRFPVLYCFTNPSLLLAQMVALAQAIVLASLDATVPTHAQELFDFDSLKSGLLFIPLSLVSFIVGPIGGWFIDNYGAKYVAVTGYTYLVPILCLFRLPKATPYPQQAIIYGTLLGFMGAGNAIIGSPSIVEAGAVVDKYHKKNPEFFGGKGPYAQLYAVNSMIFCLGLSVGPPLAGGLKEKIGYGNMNIVMAVICTLTATGSFIWLGGKPTWPKRKQKK